MRATMTMMMVLLAMPAALASPVNINDPEPGLPPGIGANDPSDDAVDLVQGAAADAEDTAEDAAAAAGELARDAEKAAEDATEDPVEGAEQTAETAAELAAAILEGDFQVNLTEPDDYIFLSSDGNEVYTKEEYEDCLDDQNCTAPEYVQESDYLTGFRVMDASYADGGRDVAVIFPQSYEHPLTNPDSRLLEGVDVAVDHGIAPDLYIGPACNIKPVAAGRYGLGVYAFEGAAPCTGLGSFSGIVERVG